MVSEKQCSKSEAEIKLTFKEMQIYIKENSNKENYVCKFHFQTRRLTEVTHPNINKTYESSEYGKKDSRLWDSDYKFIDKVEGKSLLNVEIFTNSPYDYINPLIIPKCKVNGEDVIVYPEQKTFRCPNAPTP